MGIREVIEMINRMQTDGVIEAYAIGGAVGATFYLEPAATEAGVLEFDGFQEILARHGLSGAWAQFERQFLKQK